MREPAEDAQGIALRLGTVFYFALFATLLLIPLNLRMANFHRSAFGKVQDPIGSFDYLKLQAQVIVRYLRLCFWPDPLLIDYSWEWGHHPSLASVLPKAVLLVLLIAVTVALLIRRRPSAFVGVWFFAVLAPTSSLLPLPTEIASERRMYLPLIAVVALVVLGGYAVLARMAATRQLQVAGAILLGLLVAAETARTLQRNEEFQDPVGLWADVLVRQPNNRRAYANLAKELLNRNEDQAAAEVYRKMLTIDDRDPSTWNNLAVISIRAGDWPEAERCLRRALAASPDFAVAHQNLGRVYLKTNRLDDAERELREAIRLGGDRTDRSALLKEIENARKNSPTSLPASSSPSALRP